MSYDSGSSRFERMPYALATVAISAAAMLVAVAVGGMSFSASADHSQGGGGQATPPTTEEQRQFRDCMKDNGVTLPKPSRRGRGAGHRRGGPKFDRAKFEAALAKCEQYLPAEIRERNQRMRAFHQCLQDQGVEPPDPGAGSKRRKVSRAEQEKLEAAVGACVDKMPDDMRERYQAMREFRACMTEHGAEPPQAGDRGKRRKLTREQREQFEDARDACEEYMPEDGESGGPGGGHDGPRGGHGGGHGGPGGPGGGSRDGGDSSDE